jgi:hypothetical protein
VPNVEMHINALKINWIRRVAVGEQKWVKLFRFCTNVTDDNIGVYCFGLFRFNRMKNIIVNGFWYDALFSWASFLSIVNNKDLDFNRIAKQYIWWNDKIKINGISVPGICELCSLEEKGCALY